MRLGHPGQGPQVCGEPVGPRAFAQGHVHARQLLMVQPRPPAQPPRGLQARPPLLRFQVWYQ